MKYLSDEQIKKIISVKPILQHAEQLTGVPWQAIAAIWYRESFSITPPKTPGGPFQFDPIPIISIQEALLNRFAAFPLDQKYWDYVKHNQGVNVFECATLLAACWLRHQSKFNLAMDHSDAAIKDAFYGYNGRAWGKYPESSPYVYNNFDLQHTNMVIRGSIPDPSSKTGRKFISTIDRRPGAFTVYRQLLDRKV